ARSRPRMIWKRPSRQRWPARRLPSPGQRRGAAHSRSRSSPGTIAPDADTKGADMRTVAVALALALAAAGAVRSTAADNAPTFTRDVAPILWKNCAGCHHPGHVAPFSLLTYRDAAKRAKFLAEVSTSRRMPPWRGEPDYGPHYVNERRMSDAD